MRNAHCNLDGYTKINCFLKPSKRIISGLFIGWYNASYSSRSWGSYPLRSRAHRAGSRSQRAPLHWHHRSLLCRPGRAFGRGAHFAESARKGRHALARRRHAPICSCPRRTCEDHQRAVGLWRGCECQHEGATVSTGLALRTILINCLFSPLFRIVPPPLL